MTHLDVFFDLESQQKKGQKLHGVVAAIVTNNEDPEELMRVKVKFPWLSEDDESYWARICSPVSLARQPESQLPDVGTEVLVAFDHGDIRFPYILGALLPMTGREM